jgi:3-hydroxyacyl-[acyl-carrier-protein] dehydratase
MTHTAHSEQIYIAASHPALPGHFPGQPVVPGVVLLDRVAAALERVRGARVAAFAQVKFQRPLLPGQSAQLTIEGAHEVRFRITIGADVLVSGSAEIAV